MGRFTSRIDISSKISTISFAFSRFVSVGMSALILNNQSELSLMTLFRHKSVIKSLDNAVVVE